MVAEFNEVFKRELNDVMARNIPAGGKHKAGLPRLPQFKNVQPTENTVPELEEEIE